MWRGSTPEPRDAQARWILWFSVVDPRVSIGLLCLLGFAPPTWILLSVSHLFPCSDNYSACDIQGVSVHPLRLKRMIRLVSLSAH